MEKVLTFWGAIAAFGGFFAAATLSQELWDRAFILGMTICVVGFVSLAYCGMKATLGDDNG